ncbi:hypothetical protein V6259_17975 [Marinomonas sp. TI.3.20]|uniref:hypothetical protein n=1 Tax=Marinomonas sp. TI.3.20 TaxID=3121296 RepID=UPI00311E8EFC
MITIEYTNGMDVFTELAAQGYNDLAKEKFEKKLNSCLSSMPKDKTPKRIVVSSEAGGFVGLTYHLLRDYYNAVYLYGAMRNAKLLYQMPTDVEYIDTNINRKCQTEEEYNKSHTLKKGDVLYEASRSNRGITRFYEVTKVSKSFVWVQRIESENIYNTYSNSNKIDYFNGRCVPSVGKYVNDEVTKVRANGKNQVSSTSSSVSLYPLEYTEVANVKVFRSVSWSDLD